MTDLIKALMSGQDMSLEEAKEAVAEMRERMAEGEDPEELLLEYGLEPDYVFDLM